MMVLFSLFLDALASLQLVMVVGEGFFREIFHSDLDLTTIQPGMNGAELLGHRAGQKACKSNL